VLINIPGSMDIGLEEVEIACNLVQQAAHRDANIIFGAAFDENLEDEIRVTVIATGFDDGARLAEGGFYTSAAGGGSVTPPPPPEPPVGDRNRERDARDRDGNRRQSPKEDDGYFDDIFKIFNKR
jgi:cell division protein FtsZ